MLRYRPEAFQASMTKGRACKKVHEMEHRQLKRGNVGDAKWWQTYDWQLQNVADAKCGRCKMWQTCNVAAAKCGRHTIGTCKMWQAHDVAQQNTQNVAHMQYGRFKCSRHAMWQTGYRDNEADMYRVFNNGQNE
eukprot:633803-Pelagomonas_calceolata.AAC.4